MQPPMRLPPSPLLGAASAAEPAHFESTDAARLRLAASFLSTISLRPPAARRAPPPPPPPPPRAAAAAAAGSAGSAGASPRSSVEADRRAADAPVGVSWHAAAALDFLSTVGLTRRGTAAAGGPCDGAARAAAGEGGGGALAPKDAPADGAPPTPVEPRMGEAAAARHVLTFAQLRELREAAGSPFSSLRRARVLFRGFGLGPPCLALSVLPFERGDDETLRKGGSRTKPFVSHVVTQQAAWARMQQQQQQQEQEQEQQEQQPSPQGKNTSDSSQQTPVKYKGVAYGVILHGDREENEPYDPFYLDDPELQSGKHRRVMSLPGLVESVIPFVRPQALKQQLNEQFALKHQWLTHGLTLSKIRAIKRELLAFAQDVDCDLSTVALAYVYFEKLVLRNVVNKPNRKLIAAVSLILAAKWNERHKMKGLLQQVERHYAIPRAVLFRSEFSVYVELAFKLQPEPQEVYPHFLRLLQTLERTPHEYLGEDTFQDYQTNFIKPKCILGDDELRGNSLESDLL